MQQKIKFKGAKFGGKLWFTNRAPLLRMARFHHLVQLKHYPNCTRLAEEFEVSVRTIMRDVDYMQTMLELPLEYDHQRRGYVYTKPVTWLFSAPGLHTPSAKCPPAPAPDKTQLNLPL